MAGWLACERLRGAGLFAFLTACTPRPAADVQAPDLAAPTADAEPACTIPDGALAWSGDDARCGFVFVGGDAPRLVDLVGSGEWPVEPAEACAEHTCDYQLAETALGPMIVATRRAAPGETPGWVGLGVELEGGYRFVELWGEESVLDELTPAGPVHTLAPHDCGGRLALLVVPRLGGAADEPPEPALVAAAGVPRVEGGAVVSDAVDAADCTRLPVPLP